MKYISVLFSVMLLLALGGQSTFAQSGDDLFQQALQKERVQGDLEGAISLYQKIVDNFSDARRALVAHALVQMGKSYEKLGQDLVGEARQAYEKVVRDYADQPDMVAEARSRLEAMEAAVAATGPDEPTALTMRKVVSDSFDGMPSPDERYFSYAHWGNGDLAVYDMKTGERRDLTDDAGESYVGTSIWSPDSKQIAYSWHPWNTTKERMDLRIVNVDGGEPRIVEDRLYPKAWSRDGKYIFCFIIDYKEERERLTRFEIETGSNRTIKNSPKGSLDSRHLSLSADGKYLLYGIFENGEGTPRNIHILSTDGRIDQPLIDHAANDWDPYWTPDGRGVVFLSDRSGRSGLWYVPVAEGKVSGEPRLIRQGLGTSEGFDTYGFTDDGTFYYKEVNPTANVFVAELNVGGGASQALQTPELVSERFDGTNTFPFWSPDGSKLAYFSQRKLRSYVLVIRDVQSGEERDLKLNSVKTHPIGVYPSPQWSPDGKAILLLGRDTAYGDQEGLGLYLIDLETERVTRIVDGQMGSHVFTPDGKDILFVRPLLTRQVGEIVQRNLVSGAERVLSEVKSENGQYIMSHSYLNISPDGSQLAYIRKCEWGLSESCTLEVMSLKDGSTRTLWSMTKEAMPSWAVRLHWMPDGAHLLMATYPRDEGLDEAEQQLYLLDVTSGELKPIGVPQKGDDIIFFVDLHPNGTTIAFMRGRALNWTAKGEVWALENLVFDQ